MVESEHIRNLPKNGLVISLGEYVPNSGDRKIHSGTKFRIFNLVKNIVRTRKQDWQKMLG